jgi:hypothetical protein
VDATRAKEGSGKGGKGKAGDDVDQLERPFLPVELSCLRLLARSSPSGCDTTGKPPVGLHLVGTYATSLHPVCQTTTYPGCGK